MLRSPGRMRFQTLLLIIIRFYPMQSLIRLSCKINAHFDITLENMSDPNAALKNIITQSRRECALECVSHPSCKAVNFKLHGGNCELLGQGLNRNLVEKTGWLYMTTNEKRKNVWFDTYFLSSKVEAYRHVFQCLLLMSYQEGMSSKFWWFNQK